MNSLSCQFQIHFLLSLKMAHPKLILECFGTSVFSGLKMNWSLWGNLIYEFLRVFPELIRVKIRLGCRFDYPVGINEKNPSNDSLRELVTAISKHLLGNIKF